MNRIDKINQLFSQCFAKSNTFKSARKTTDVDEEVSRIIKTDICSELRSLLNDSNYIVKGSVGSGLATKTPWIAIMDKDITTSTRTGVYIVFLFSSDYKHVYLTLNQGTTVPGKFGPRIKIRTIESKTKSIRKETDIQDDKVFMDNNADIADKRYKAGTIYYSPWDINDSQGGKDLLSLYLDIYRKYKMKLNDNQIAATANTEQITNNLSFSINSIIDIIQSTGLIYSDSLIKRYVFSLLSKRFLILSGLAGSGKTQLAITFANAMIKDDSQKSVVPVGADWTNREPLLGYANALEKDKYVRPKETGVLDLIIRASKPENADKPYFLILDEMNMSYVERYFSDFLSAMESNEDIMLWGGPTEKDDTPASIRLPKNLFIIGTINVDETTYLFSPKVLDRANVIEFKITQTDMSSYLASMKQIDTDSIYGEASEMGKDFIEKANELVSFDNKDEICSTLLGFFKELKSVNAEFGYRSANEIFRFITMATQYDDSSDKMSDDQILDAAIVQKLLPKLHGSKKTLPPILASLWNICGTGIKIEEATDVPEETKFPITADKILRMYKYVIANGFTSFAEA